MSFPGAEEGKDRFAFFVMDKGKPKGFAWVWLDRPEPKKARVPNPSVLAVRVANNAQKDLILAPDPKKFFTEQHYNGYPAMLVRLKEVTVADLRVLLEEGGGAVRRSRSRHVHPPETAHRQQGEAAAQGPPRPRRPR